MTGACESCLTRDEVAEAGGKERNPPAPRFAVRIIGAFGTRKNRETAAVVVARASLGQKRQSRPLLAVR